MKPRLHLVALPHTKVSPDFCGCAYTNKARLFCKALGEKYDIFLYAPEGPEVPGATLIPCLSDERRLKTFGADNPNRLPDWPTDEQAASFNLRAASEILNNRAGHKDLVLLSGGFTHAPIKDALKIMTCAEPFVGYEGILTDRCAFESYAWMHTVYAQKGIKDIRWYDRVIPPFVDHEEFPTLNNGQGDYLLFLGRLIDRKGPHTVKQIAKASGMKLVVAGANGGTQLLGTDGVEYRGPVNISERAAILAGAKALVCPTTFVEPGGNVAIEAMMAGTPVITADFGVFSETVKDGVSGFHFRTLREGVEAVRMCVELDPNAIRGYAVAKYSLEAIAPKFDKWFTQLGELWGDGWNSL